jgi:hypothetical protein
MKTGAKQLCYESLILFCEVPPCPEGGVNIESAPMTGNPFSQRRVFPQQKIRDKPGIAR